MNISRKSVGVTRFFGHSIVSGSPEVAGLHRPHDQLGAEPAVVEPPVARAGEAVVDEIPHRAVVVALAELRDRQAADVVGAFGLQDHLPAIGEQLVVERPRRDAAWDCRERPARADRCWRRAACRLSSSCRHARTASDMERRISPLPQFLLNSMLNRPLLSKLRRLLVCQSGAAVENCRDQPVVTRPIEQLVELDVSHAVVGLAWLQQSA